MDNSKTLELNWKNSGKTITEQLATVLEAKFVLNYFESFSWPRDTKQRGLALLPMIEGPDDWVVGDTRHVGWYDTVGASVEINENDYARFVVEGVRAKIVAFGFKGRFTGIYFVEKEQRFILKLAEGFVKLHRKLKGKKQNH